MVKHQGKPLAGVSVEVTTNTEGTSTKLISDVTATDGTVSVTNLPPGEYWLHANLLGVTAGIQCFHVRNQASRKAKRNITYEWGDLAPATRRMAGKLIDCQPGNIGNRLRDLAQCVEVPISGSRLKLQNPVSGTSYGTTSDDHGSFEFDPVPNGTYVLHVEGGKAGIREYDSADLLVELSPAARWNFLLLTRRDPGAGSCGGTSVELRATTD